MMKGYRHRRFYIKMLYCTIGTCSLFLMAAQVRHVSSLKPDNTQLANMIKAINQRQKITQACDENNTESWFIYCSGDMLAAVNLHNLELDSKTFVDRPLKADPKVVRQEYVKKFGNQPVEDIDAQELLAFRDRYFGSEGRELEVCVPVDWNEEPPKIAKIKDKYLKKFALFLNRQWKRLCRRVKPLKHPERHSLISVPEEFIVPGGRFREYYYWDAYWIVKGLIVSNLTKMVRKMLTNFLHCVKKYGFVPNGGRVYYLRRSQPPFLIPMAYEYYEATKDIEFVKKNFDGLVKELEFWLNSRSLTLSGRDGKNYTVYQYRAPTNVPRPESYRGDIEAAYNVREKIRGKFFQDIASAAESGWDFSTRWFKDRHTIQTIETTNVVPIDLNALLCWNANILKYFAATIGRENDAIKFEEMERRMWISLKAVFYNETEKAWFDYNLRTKSHNTLFYPSVSMPLFTSCYSELDQDKSAQIVEFMNRSGVFEYKNGIPSSQVTNAGEQYDFPNGYSPLQHIIIEGMRKSNNPDVQEVAYKLARKWVLANYDLYQNTGKMFDRINVVEKTATRGMGGEYDVQDGFGWTNGVILDFLATYYDRMTVTDDEKKPGSEESCENKAHYSFSLSWKLIIFTVLVITLSHSNSLCIC